MAASRERFRAAGAGTLVVCQAKPTVLAMFLRNQPPPVPFVCDPDRAAYRAFGLEETTWLSFFRLSVLWGYVKLMARGGRLRRPYEGENVLQLGGDFVLDCDGRVVFAYRSRFATDRPTVAALLAALRTPTRR